MKSFKIKAVIYILIFIAASVLTYIFTIGKSVYYTNTHTMNSAGLPVIFMTTENGLNYNYLHGYTGDVNEKQIHDAITPIEEDRHLGISVKQYGCVVSGVSYELWTTDLETLVERNESTDYSGKDGVIKADFEFKNLLDEGKEYLLKIKLNTETYEEVVYYTRLVKLGNASVENKLTYINDFSENTRKDETLGKVTAKLEPNSTGDNTNLGRVNIHSKLSQVGFANLAPELLTDRFFTITEIDETRASVLVTYKVATSDNSGDYEYNVEEFFRIYQPDSTVTYVYNFERWMNQIFSPSKGISGDGEIYLGIRSDTDINMKSSSNGNITAFEIDGVLWTFSAVKNSFSEVFSFADAKSDGVREEYDNFGIKILNVYNNGNVDFLVYGYMNRGQHEGELGISVCKYETTGRTTSEIAFIPRTDSFEIIAKDVEELAYMTMNDILYIYSNGSVFFLDCNTKEYMVTDMGVLPDASYICQEEAVYLYQTGDDVNTCNELKILYLDTGEIYTETADADEYIKMLGFIDGNIVYGKTDADMLTVTNIGEVISPMHTIVIMDRDRNVVRNYGDENIFVTEAEFSEAQIIFKRMAVNAEGKLVEITSDSVLSGSSDGGASLEVITQASDFRQKEQYISMIVAGNGRAGQSGCRYEYTDNSTVLISEIYQQDREYYYAYGFGGLYRICDSLSEALNAAYESAGVVVDYNANTIWNRYKDTTHKISLPDEIYGFSGNSLENATDALLLIAGKEADSAKLYEKGYSMLECIEGLAGTAKDLSGSKIDYALYFVSEGHPLIAKTGENTYELVYRYDSKNVFTHDFVSGTEKSYTKEKFDDLISGYGSILITY